MAQTDANPGRREALVRLLQLGGASAGLTAGGLWLCQRDQPASEIWTGVI
jgi:hypothetical protein